MILNSLNNGMQADTFFTRRFMSRMLQQIQDKYQMKIFMISLHILLQNPYRKMYPMEIDMMKGFSQKTVKLCRN